MARLDNNGEFGGKIGEEEERGYLDSEILETRRGENRESETRLRNASAYYTQTFAIGLPAGYLIRQMERSPSLWDRTYIAGHPHRLSLSSLHFSSRTSPSPTPLPSFSALNKAWKGNLLLKELNFRYEVMAHRFLRDVEADAWERSDFPIICEQKQIMTRSARFVHDHSQFLDRDRVGMEDVRNRRFAKLAVK
ncbi:hypothetical protein F8388_005780 [Cannabis sativa]|uniref:Uncharacterized protein n=1 Tax=Cannabis sativa TaxID=3483 RepID=A0A7J6HQA1_CANSA|nr:hypothetical protein F8388_005780 [Cannabis sativa]